MILQDYENNIYKVGLKLDYQAKQVDIFNEEFKKEDVTQLSCGRKHYVVLNKENKLMVWGNVFKEKAVAETNGFGLYYGDSLFEGNKIRELSMKYSIFGALVDN